MGHIGTGERYSTILVRFTVRIFEPCIVHIRQFQDSIDQDELLPAKIVHGQRAVWGRVEKINNSGDIKTNL